MSRCAEVEAKRKVASQAQGLPTARVLRAGLVAFPHPLPKFETSAPRPHPRTFRNRREAKDRSRPKSDLVTGSRPRTCGRPATRPKSYATVVIPQSSCGKALRSLTRSTAATATASHSGLFRELRRSGKLRAWLEPGPRRPTSHPLRTFGTPAAGVRTALSTKGSPDCQAFFGTIKVDPGCVATASSRQFRARRGAGCAAPRWERIGMAQRNSPHLQKHLCGAREPRVRQGHPPVAAPCRGSLPASVGHSPLALFMLSPAFAIGGGLRPQIRSDRLQGHPPGPGCRRSEPLSLLSTAGSSSARPVDWECAKGQWGVAPLDKKKAG
jgi:hypothetical protein